MIIKNLIFNIIFGISFGIVLAFYFKKDYIYHGPNSLDVQRKVFKIKDKCFRLIPEVIKCSLSSY